MSFLAQTRPVLRFQSQTFRSLHTTVPVHSVGGHYHHLPFKWPGDKKGIFGLKVFLYLASGFSIPFAATAYQLKKAGGK